MKSLPLYKDELTLSTVAGSTTHRGAELAEMLVLVFAAKARQAEAGQRRAQQKAATMDQAIGHVSGALPVNHRDAIGTIRRRFERLLSEQRQALGIGNRLPSRRTIAAWLQARAKKHAS